MRERKHPRLREYDYSPNGAYFVTFCTRDRGEILGRVVGRGILDAPQVELTAAGECVRDSILWLDRSDPALSVEHFVIMPNHVHLLIVLSENEKGASRMPRPTNMRIPQLISSLKRFTNRKCGEKLWQNSYYDHVIRDENDFLMHWNYIESNPARWAEDKYYI